MNLEMRIELQLELLLGTRPGTGRALGYILRDSAFAAILPIPPTPFTRASKKQ